MISFKSLLDNSSRKIIPPGIFVAEGQRLFLRLFATLHIFVGHLAAKKSKGTLRVEDLRKEYIWLTYRAANPGI